MKKKKKKKCPGNGKFFYFMIHKYIKVIEKFNEKNNK